MLHARLLTYCVFTNHPSYVPSFKRLSRKSFSVIVGNVKNFPYKELTVPWFRWMNFFKTIRIYCRIILTREYSVQVMPPRLVRCTFSIFNYLPIVGCLYETKKKLLAAKCKQNSKITGHVLTVYIVGCFNEKTSCEVQTKDKILRGTANFSGRNFLQDDWFLFGFVGLLTELK